MSNYRDRKRKPIAEINVVPYIDVMLVLLIIFMEEFVSIVNRQLTIDAR